jgi:hypothetical protein
MRRGYPTDTDERCETIIDEGCGACSLRVREEIV